MRAIATALLVMLMAGVAIASCPLNCKQNMPISLGYNCQRVIHPDDVLHYPPSYCDYEITVMDQYGNPIGNVVDYTHVGQTLQVKVKHDYDICWASIVVQDHTAPVAVCDQNTVVSIGGGGVARVYAHTFDDGSYDNCSIANIQVRRQQPGNCPDGVYDDTQFRDFVEFCCADVGWHMAIMRVYDHAGNYNDCMVNIDIVDNGGIDLVCPPDITVSCNYPLDIWDLSEFGKIAQNYHSRDNIYIDDYYYQPSGYAGKDGYVTSSSCSGGGYNDVWVSEDIYPNLECGQGIIYRTFTASTGGGWGSSVSCTQKIFIKDPHPFNRYDIHFPSNVTVEYCGEQDLSPDQTGKPWFNDDICSIVATSYKDEVFTVVDQSCFKILRTWKVLDWCQYNPYTGKGLWTDVQVIKVMNTTEPTFQDCSDRTFRTADVQGCKGKAYLQAAVMDDCTPDSLLLYKYYIDLNNDGGPLYSQYDIQGNTDDATGYYNFGTHRILWLVEDLCGNTASCEYLFTVEDGKKPSPVCYHGLSTVVMPSSGMIELTASMFNVSSFDNCTPANQLKYSFSTDPYQATRVFTCEDRDTAAVQMYVHDKAGNYEYCTTYVIIADNNGVCPDQPLVYIAGSLMDRNDRGVGKADVYLNALDRSMEIKQSDKNGSYEYGAMGVRFDENYRLRAKKTDNHANGISVSDLLAIQYHIIGTVRIEDPLALLAADVDMNKKIDILDVVDSRNLLMGNKTKFAHGQSWIFVPEGTEFARPEYPYDYDAQIEVVASTANPTTVNFKAVKLGDINATARADNGRNAPLQVVTNLDVNNVSFQEGDIVTVPFYINNVQSVSGLQLEMNVDQMVAADLDVLPGLLDLGGSLKSALLDRGIIKSVALTTAPIELTSENTPLFYVTFAAQRDGDLSNVFGIGSGEMLSQVVVDGVETAIDINLNNGNNAAKNDIILSANPFKDQAQVRIMLEQTQQVRITVTDLTGRVLFSQTCESCDQFDFQLNGSILSGNGVYVVDVQSPFYNDSRKVIFLGE